MDKDKPITTEKILAIMEELWKDTPRRMTAHTGKLGYKGFLDAIDGGDVDINTIREGMYSIGTNVGFVGFEYLGMPDGYRAVDVEYNKIHGKDFISKEDEWEEVAVFWDREPKTITSEYEGGTITHTELPMFDWHPWIGENYIQNLIKDGKVRAKRK